MTQTTRKLILASSSRYRRELLSRLNVGFEAISPDVDETPLQGEAPEALAIRLAEMKAQAIAEQHPGALVIGSDQVPALPDGPLLSKPGSVQIARQQLAAQSGSSVNFYTGVTVCCLETGFSESHTDLTSVHFRELTAEEIDAYIEAEQPLDCAGSFKSEGLGINLFNAIENRDPTALIGLPMIWVAGALRRATNAG